MTLEARIVAALEAVGIDMKAVQALASARHVVVGLRSGLQVAVPLSATEGLRVGLATGASVTVQLGA